VKLKTAIDTLHETPTCAAESSRLVEGRISRRVITQRISHETLPVSLDLYAVFPVIRMLASVETRTILKDSHNNNNFLPCSEQIVLHSL